MNFSLGEWNTVTPIVRTVVLSSCNSWIQDRCSQKSSPLNQFLIAGLPFLHGVVRVEAQGRRCASAKCRPEWPAGAPSIQGYVFDWEHLRIGHLIDGQKCHFAGLMQSLHVRVYRTRRTDGMESGGIICLFWSMWSVGSLQKICWCVCSTLSTLSLLSPALRSG